MTIFPNLNGPSVQGRKKVGVVRTNQCRITHLFLGIKPDAKTHGKFPRNFPLKSVYCLRVGVILGCPRKLGSMVRMSG